MSDYFSINTKELRTISADIANLKTKYDALYEDITNLIVNQLSLYWVDEQYDAVQEEYKTKHSHTLEKLSDLIKEFSCLIAEAADDADHTFGR